jgi:hypothetical protein
MFSLPVESGRLVVLARRRRPKVPMRDACFLSPHTVSYGKLALVVTYEAVEGHPGTLAARNFFVGDPEVADQLCEGTEMTRVAILAHAPRILVGDHSFIYQKMDDDQVEGSRALRACEGHRRIGTYRADSSDIGCCLRTGWRRCVYTVGEVRGGVAGQIESTPEMED